MDMEKIQDFLELILDIGILEQYFIRIEAVKCPLGTDHIL